MADESKEEKFGNDDESAISRQQTSTGSAKEIEASNSRSKLLRSTDSQNYGAFVAGNSVIYPKSKSACCLGGSIPFSYDDILAPEDAQRLHELKRLLGTSFDSSNKDHETALYELWTLSFPEEELDARRSEQWMKLGFQGHDPATDFRGGGLASLHFMIYMAKQYPAQWRGLLNPYREYSLAIACINVTHFLRESLGLSPPGQKSIPLKVKPPSRKAKKAFALVFAAYQNSVEELFCSCLEVMDGLWIDILKGKGEKFTLEDLATLTSSFRRRVLSVFNKLPTKRVTLLQLRRRLIRGLPRRIPPTMPLEENKASHKRKRAVTPTGDQSFENPVVAKASQ